MTKSEEMKRLEADMASDKELGKRFYGAVDRIATENKLQSDGELFAKAAAELGYNITAADFERLDAEDEELNPDELALTAGGLGQMCWVNYGCFYGYETDEQDENGHNANCITAWHCLTATLHTETESKDVSCWKDYICVAVNNRVY